MKYLLILLLAFCSCNNTNVWPQAVIYKIEAINGRPELFEYHSETNGWENAYVVAPANLYQVGDTIKFCR